MKKLVQMKLYSIQIEKNYYMILEPFSKIKRDKFSLIIIQKFIGPMSIETLNEKRPYIFRCVIFNNNSTEVLLF